MPLMLITEGIRGSARRDDLTAVAVAVRIRRDAVPASTRPRFEGTEAGG